MSYRLKAQAAIASEVKRIANKQLALAIEELRAVGDRRSDNAVHEARRHVKKVRALLRLVRPRLGDGYDVDTRRMRTANRMLAPIADGRAVVDTLARLGRKGRASPSRRALTAIRGVLNQRAARIDRKAELDRVLPKVARLLRLEDQRVAEWTLGAGGFRAIAPGLEASVRRARKAMTRTAARPTTEHYHAWRRRVKDLWFQVRLLEDRCGNALVADQRRLEDLDGLLGEYHNVALLEQVLTKEALLSRQMTARSLRLLRRDLAELRHRAALLGERIFKEKPRPFVRRIKRLWRAARTVRRATPKEAPWPSAA